MEVPSAPAIFEPGESALLFCEKDVLTELPSLPCTEGLPGGRHLLGYRDEKLGPLMVIVSYLDLETQGDRPLGLFSGLV